MQFDRLVLLLAGLSLPASTLAHGTGGLTHGVSHARAERAAPVAGRSWLAGDHHIHSEFSADYVPDPTNPSAPPKPLLGKDGRYSITKNAEMARTYGLRWIVTTDHGGPLHSKLNYEQTYPALLASRKAVPDVLQFYGMEFDTPAGDHSSLIVPHTPREREQLREIEAGFSQREAYPLDPARNTEPRMIEALRHMQAHGTPPVLIANHPSRSAETSGGYGKYTPQEFRNWNDAAPNVAVGMEGAPGHQANALNPDGTIDPAGVRGGYKKSPTLGGFDQMTARLGGLWDSMLGEGRRWWITATSDSHANWRDGGNDFWPGEYSKTFVHARAQQSDILDGLRNGRVFVTTGDLVSQVEVTARPVKGKRLAGMGGTLVIPAGGDVQISIEVRDPAGVNRSGRASDVQRIDLIGGEVSGRASDRSADRNASTRVLRRFTSADWKRNGEILSMTYVLKSMTKPYYVRVRGTNTAELEPLPDAPGEDPWSDLWFYSNPVFVSIK